MFQNRIVNMDSKSIPHTPLSDHLMIYMDINGTIMASDAANGKSIDIAINQMLAENTLANWTENLSTENLEPLATLLLPPNDSKNEALKKTWKDKLNFAKSKCLAITFRDFIETFLIPGEHKNKSIKSARQEVYRKFQTYLQILQHPLAKEITTKFNTLKENLNKSILFTSFINMIKYLESSKKKYTIILSTFGDDLQMVINEIERLSSLKCDSVMQYNKHTLMTSDNKTLTHKSDIHNCFKQFKLCGVKYDWKYWNSNGEKHNFAKLFIADQSSIFFDDNVTEKEIICPIPLTNEALIEKNHLQLQYISQGQIVCVNTLDACLDGSYFIDKIKLYHSQRFSRDLKINSKEKTF